MRFLALIALGVLAAAPAQAETFWSHDINGNISADKVGSTPVWYPRYKIVSGDAGTDNDVGPSNPLPVSGTFSVTTGANPAGSVSNNAAVGSGSASTFTVPAHAVGFLLENESTTVIPIRWAVGSTATSSVGNYYEAGRDTGYVPLAANISVIGVGGTASVSVQWVLSQ